MKGIAFVTDNSSLRMKVNEQNDFPDSFGCSIYSPETTGNYFGPVCKTHLIHIRQDLQLNGDLHHIR